MKRFRGLIQEAGFEIRPGEHPIIPIMLGEAKLARETADMLLKVFMWSVSVIPLFQGAGTYSHTGFRRPFQG